MATFKIALEDKAAFLNRMEKAGVGLDTDQAVDNKLEGYFEVTIDEPKQLDAAKTILKQSPKINTINKMETTKKKLTKSDLKEMVRQELQAVLAEKKKAKDEDKEKLDEVEGVTGAQRAAEELMNGISSGDPFLTGVGLVAALVTGVVAGPTVVAKLKGYYKALTQKDPNKAEALKDLAAEEGVQL